MRCACVTAFAPPDFASLLIRCSAPMLPRCSVSGGKPPRLRQPTRSRFGIVCSQAVRPSARDFLKLRDALLQEPGFREELGAFFEGLHDTSPAEPVDFP